MAGKRHITASNLGVTFPTGQTVLADVCFGCDKGEFVAIVGPSGCGKSTLLRCIADLQPPSAGEIVVHDGPVRMAYVFQEANLLPWRTVLKNVNLPLELEPASKRPTDADVVRALSLVNLHTVDHHKRPHQLSGGMQMRVSLARAIVTQPNVMLLDEPFGAIDDISRQQLNFELQQLWRDQGWTALFVTHNVSEAVFLSNRILVMSQNPGRIAETIEVPFAFPRDDRLRSTPAFAELCGHVTDRLRQAAEHSA